MLIRNTLGLATQCPQNRSGTFVFQSQRPQTIGIAEFFLFLHENIYIFTLTKTALSVVCLSVCMSFSLSLSLCCFGTNYQLTQKHTNLKLFLKANWLVGKQTFDFDF